MAADRLYAAVWLLSSILTVESWERGLLLLFLVSATLCLVSATLCLVCVQREARARGELP